MNATLPSLPATDGSWNRRCAFDLCQAAPSVDADALDIVVMDLFQALERVRQTLAAHGALTGVLNRGAIIDRACEMLGTAGAKSSVLNTDIEVLNLATLAPLLCPESP
jgi:GGDEF domain-containing protein